LGINPSSCVVARPELYDFFGHVFFINWVNSLLLIKFRESVSFRRLLKNNYHM
jgi:hypothetical protein